MDKEKFILLYRIILIILAGTLTAVSFLPVFRIDTSLVYYDAKNPYSEFNLFSFHTMEFFEEYGEDASRVDVGILFMARNGGRIFNFILDALAGRNTYFSNARMELRALITAIVREYREFSPNFERVDAAAYAAAAILESGFLALLLVPIVFAVVLIIKYIRYLIRSLVHINDEEDIRMERFPFAGYAITMLVLHCITASVASKGLHMGAAIWGSLIIFCLVCLLRAAKVFFFTEKEERKQVLAKQAIEVFSSVAVAVLLANFTRIGFVKELQNAHVPSTTVMLFTLFAIVSIFLLTIVFKNTVKKIAHRKCEKVAREERKVITSIVFAAIALIIAFVPVFLSVHSAEAQREAIVNKEFRIWYGEYKAEGTKLNMEYESLKRDQSAAQERYEEYKTSEADTDSDFSLTDPEFLVAYMPFYTKQQIRSLNVEIQEIEQRPIRPIMCAVSGILFLLAEIAYIIVPKHLDKREQVLPLGASVPSEDVDEAVENDQPILESASENGEPSVEELFAMGEEYAQRTE